LGFNPSTDKALYSIYRHLAESSFWFGKLTLYHWVTPAKSITYEIV